MFIKRPRRTWRTRLLQIVAVCMLLASITTWSACVFSPFHTDFGTEELVAYFEFGAIDFWYQSEVRILTNGKEEGPLVIWRHHTKIVPQGARAYGLRLPDGYFRHYEVPAYESSSDPQAVLARTRRIMQVGFVLPLWIPTLLAAAWCAWLFMPCRKGPPGHCAFCSYNLTGNVSGRCPECGERA